MTYDELTARLAALTAQNRAALAAIEKAIAGYEALRAKNTSEAQRLAMQYIEATGKPNTPRMQDKLLSRYEETEFWYNAVDSFCFEYGLVDEDDQ